MAAKDKEILHTGWHDAWGIMLLAFCVLMWLSLASYHSEDIGLFQYPPNKPPANFIGPVGAWFACLIFMAFGVGGYLVPVATGILGLLLLFKRTGRIWPKTLWMLVLLLAVLTLAELESHWWEPLRARLNIISPGGLLGSALAQAVLIKLLGRVGTGILVAALLVVSLIFILEIHPVVLFRRLVSWGARLYVFIEEKLDERRDRRDQLDRESRDIARKRKRLEDAIHQQLGETPAPPPTPESAPVREAPDEETMAEKILSAVRTVRKTERKPPAPDKSTGSPVTAGSASDYQLPPLSVISPLPPESERAIKGDFESGSRILKETLAEFGIDAEVTNVERGPVVTRYELLPAAGVRVEKIVSLSNNIALAMKAETVRVQAPIPGKGVVGIEVPNPKTTMVYLREMLESETWKSRQAGLPLCLGKDVGGREIIADLTEMPHLLIAGATGSGKTVCMNSILAGLLMSRTPEEMRLMLIDPKIVEFSAYNGLPHLVAPVITEVRKVSIGLRWALEEMEKRYKLFARVAVRNIHAYNRRPIVKQTELFADGAAPEENHHELPARLPFIVIIVDELADLMQQAKAEVELQVVRLAQLSRAVGIHMILATQRPSVDVITGTIKANVPARIAFKVAQKVDSRTILDGSGADKLLGKGDLLFLMPGAHKIIRAQGTMTGDQDIQAIVDFIKRQGRPQYELGIAEKIEKNTVELPDAEDDEMLETAIEIIRQTGRASTSSLQRRLRIGYTRAARLMDLMEHRGIVGPPRGSDPREILVDLDGQIPQNVTGEEEER